MDETTKVLIGTISGFIIAFLAEPVKNYFQDKAKLNRLRIALYKELFIDYIVLEMIVRGENFEPSKVKLVSRVKLLKNSLRSETYGHAIKNEISLFHQLTESVQISLLQGMMTGFLMDLVNEMKDIADTKFITFTKKHSVNIVAVSKHFVESFEENCYEHTFDPKILRRFMSSEKYKEIIAKVQIRKAKDDAQ